MLRRKRKKEKKLWQSTRGMLRRKQKEKKRWQSTRSCCYSQGVSPMEREQVKIMFSVQQMLEILSVHAQLSIDSLQVPVLHVPGAPFSSYTSVCPAAWDKYNVFQLLYDKLSGLLQLKMIKSPHKQLVVRNIKKANFNGFQLRKSNVGTDE